MTHRRTRPTVVSLVIAALALPPLPALAQSDEQRAAARDLAIDGADAFDQGRYEDAIDRFKRAETLVHATPHLLYLARSYAKLRQFVKAREAYMKILNEQLAPNAPQALKDAREAAQSEISIVEPKIGRLTVTVPGKEKLQNLTVQVDGAPVPAVLVGAPQPVDPGEHRIEGIATGFRAEPQVVSFGEGEQKTVALKMIEDASAAPPPAPGEEPPPAPPDPALPPPDAPPPATQSGSSGLRIGSYVAFGVGAVGLGLGTVFMLQSSSKRSEADDLCTLEGGGCPTTVESEVNALDDDADSAQTLGIVGFAVGGVGLAAGVTMFLLSSGGSSPTTGKRGGDLTVSPYVTPRSLGLTGTF